MVAAAIAAAATAINVSADGDVGDAKFSQAMPGPGQHVTC